MQLKQELNMEYHGKYCICCGMLSVKVWKRLHEEGVTQKKKIVWNNHYAYDGADSFYDSNMLKYCAACGVKLKDDDILTISQSSQFWGAPCSETIVVGYKCGACGQGEQF